MASEERKELEKALKPLMKKLGFKKTGPTWHYDAGNCVQILNLQGSQWSKNFYINLGIYFKEIGSELKPKEYHCQIRERLCELTDDLNVCNKILDFESDIALVERIELLKKMVSSYAIPWLEKCSETEGAKHYLLHEKKHGIPVLKETFEYLGIKQS